MREFIEFDIPGVGRGRTEYGIDPANANEPMYVRIHWPNRPPETLTFANDLAYRRHWDSFTVYTERGSPEWEAMLRDMRHYHRYNLPRRGESGSRTMAGDRSPPPPPAPVGKSSADPAAPTPDDSDRVPAHIDDESASTNRLPTKQRKLGERIGSFELHGNVELHDGVLHREIWKIERTGGAAKTTGVSTFLDFFEAMIVDAESTGARRLRISGTAIINPNVLKIDRLARAFGGSVRRIDGRNIVIDIPLPASGRRARRP